MPSSSSSVHTGGSNPSGTAGGVNFEISRMTVGRFGSVLSGMEVTIGVPAYV
jgi:hypothetical protein